MRSPFGNIKASAVGVSQKYTKRGNLTPQKNDIGVIRLSEPVAVLRTFMGLQVTGLSSGANVKTAGYAGFFAPGGSFPDQRVGEGIGGPSIPNYGSYQIATKSGISGSPQWDSVSRRIIGVHAQDLGLLCAGGPRFGGRNSSLGRTIFGMSCPNSNLAGDQDENVMDWELLRELTLSDLEILVPIEELRVVDPFFDADDEPDRQVFQIIENNYYEWNEYDVQGPLGDTFQMVEMISPRHEWLSAIHAQALLSASRNWGVKYSHLPPEEMWSTYPYDAESVVELDSTLEDISDLNDDDQEEDEFVLLDAYEGNETVGDIDGDGAVNGADLAQLLGNWNNPNQSNCDLNLDGIVDGQDLATLLGNWSN